MDSGGWSELDDYKAEVKYKIEFALKDLAECKTILYGQHNSVTPSVLAIRSATEYLNRACDRLVVLCKGYAPQ